MKEEKKDKFYIFNWIAFGFSIITLIIAIIALIF